MTRNLKDLGLAFAAMFVMGAVAASAAQATPTVTAASYPAILTASALTTLNFVTNTGQEINCTGISGKATLTGNATEVTAENIAYSGCTAKVGVQTLEMTVNMTGCDYKFSGGSESGAGHFSGGTVEMNCPTGVTGADLSIYQTAAKHAANEPLCTFTTWKEVTGGEGTATNTAGSPNDIDVRAVNVQTNVTRDGSILCGSPSSARLNGEATIKAYEDNNGTEGNQIGITISEGA